MSEPATPAVDEPAQKPKRSARQLGLGCLGCLGALVVLFLIVGACSALTGGGDSKTTTAAPAKSTAPTPSTSPTVTKAASPAEELKKAISDKLGKPNREGLPLPKVTASARPGQPITVEWAISENLTEGLTKTGARSDTVDILRAVREKATWPYSEVVVRGTYALVDQLGRTSERQVVFARYSKGTVDAINFENFLSTNVWTVADGRLIHPAFQD